LEILIEGNYNLLTFFAPAKKVTKKAGNGPRI
jgi:hypothetical protein